MRHRFNGRGSMGAFGQTTEGAYQPTAASAFQAGAPSVIPPTAVMPGDPGGNDYLQTPFDAASSPSLVPQYPGASYATTPQMIQPVQRMASEREAMMLGPTAPADDAVSPAMITGGYLPPPSAFSQQVIPVQAGLPSHELLLPTAPPSAMPVLPAAQPAYDPRAVPAVPYQAAQAQAPLYAPQQMPEAAYENPPAASLYAPEEMSVEDMAVPQMAQGQQALVPYQGQAVMQYGGEPDPYRKWLIWGGIAVGVAAVGGLAWWYWNRSE